MSFYLNSLLSRKYKILAVTARYLSIKNPLPVSENCIIHIINAIHIYKSTLKGMNVMCQLH